MRKRKRSPKRPGVKNRQKLPRDAFSCVGNIFLKSGSLFHKPFAAVVHLIRLQLYAEQMEEFREEAEKEIDSRLDI